METKSAYIIVGAFVLTFIVGLIGFGVWIAKVDLDTEFRDYDVYIQGSVSGLYKRSNVFYLGIPVGEVRNISLAPNDPSTVKITIRINADVPINSAARAKLEFQGLTGVAYIELYGGDANAPPLVVKDGDINPVIQSERSAFSDIVANAPNLIDEAINTVEQIRKLLNDENLAEVASILKNVDDLSENLATGTENLPELMVTAEQALTDASAAAKAVEKLALSGDDLLTGGGAAMIADARVSLQVAQSAISRIDGLLEANSEAVTDFVNVSLPEVSRMIVDLRITARSLSRLVKRVEQNPAEVLFGSGEVEYDLESRKVKEEGK